MKTQFLNGPDPAFLETQIPILLKRFSISFVQDETCIEYFLCNRRSGNPISKNLILSYEFFSKSLYVSKFYPEIYKQAEHKYLSAACFYMLIHHAAGIFHSPDQCHVNLETDKFIFEQFYARLEDFHFKICYARPAERVYVRGSYHNMPFPTNMITLQSDHKK